jgi:hypothetical protein
VAAVGSEGDPAREPSLKTIPEKKTNTPLAETRLKDPKKTLFAEAEELLG